MGQGREQLKGFQSHLRRRVCKAALGCLVRPSVTCLHAHSHICSHALLTSKPSTQREGCLWMGSRMGAAEEQAHGRLLIGRLAGVYPVAVHIHWF